MVVGTLQVSSYLGFFPRIMNDRSTSAPGIRCKINLEILTTHRLAENIQNIYHIDSNGGTWWYVSNVYCKNLSQFIELSTLDTKL